MLTWVNSYKSLSVYFSFSDAMASNHNKEYLHDVYMYMLYRRLLNKTINASS